MRNVSDLSGVVVCHFSPQIAASDRSVDSKVVFSSDPTIWRFHRHRIGNIPINEAGVTKICSAGVDTPQSVSRCRKGWLPCDGDCHESVGEAVWRARWDDESILPQSWWPLLCWRRDWRHHSYDLIFVANSWNDVSLASPLTGGVWRFGLKGFARSKSDMAKEPFVRNKLFFLLSYLITPNVSRLIVIHFSP